MPSILKQLLPMLDSFFETCRGVIVDCQNSAFLLKFVETSALWLVVFYRYSSAQLSIQAQGFDTSPVG